MNDVSTPAATTTTEPAAEEELPTHCDVPWCGQPLLLRRPGRTRCERCQMGRTRKPVDPAEQAAEDVVKESPVPCAGCGQTEVPDRPGLLLPLADGFCLGCRVQGLHLT